MFAGRGFYLVIRPPDFGDEPIEISLHTQNRIAGTITLERKGLMFFAIPYDKGWSARVDGNKAELSLVNAGFLGLIMDKGTHTVELKFEPPYLIAGAATSLISLLVYGYLLYRFKSASRDSAEPQENKPKNDSNVQ
jgi:uncharacterized membrane protein YfhO